MYNVDTTCYILQLLDRKDFFKYEIYTICKYFNNVFNEKIIKIMYHNIVIWNFPNLYPQRLVKLTHLTSLNLRNYAGSILNGYTRVLTNLTSLSLRDNTSTDYGIEYLTNLTYLDLSFNKTITNYGISSLCKLKTLTLTCNNMITKINHLTNLTSINLDRNSCITMESLKSLPKLSLIMLRHNHKIVKNKERDKKWKLTFVY